MARIGGVLCARLTASETELSSKCPKSSVERKSALRTLSRGEVRVDRDWKSG
jgi:hypothetical protein